MANLPCKITENVIRLISLGYIYIFGKDKMHRPTLIIDSQLWPVLLPNYPELVDLDNIAYAKRFMI